LSCVESDEITGKGKGEGQRKGRVMEGRGGRGKKRMERRRKKGGGLAPWVQGIDAPGLQQ